MQIFIFAILAIIIGYFAYIKNKQTALLFSSGKYLIEGEKEYQVLQSKFVTQRFMLSWLIFPSSSIFVTNKRIIIRPNTKLFYYISPMSIFYESVDLKKFGGLFTSYLMQDMRTDKTQTIIQAQRKFLNFVWSMKMDNLIDIINTAKKIN